VDDSATHPYVPAFINLNSFSSTHFAFVLRK
jgi:hypothetical protein